MHLGSFLVCRSFLLLGLFFLLLLSPVSAFQDMDNDGVDDLTDNCPNTPNPDQGDRNSDDVGDICTYDFAIRRIIVPKTVRLTLNRPERTKAVRVIVHNQSLHEEIIPDLDTLQAFISLQVEALDTPAMCPDITPELDASRLMFPLVFKRNRARSIRFLVTFGDCVPDRLRTTRQDPEHEDYRYSATLSRVAIDGMPDMDPTDDNCPRTIAPPFRIDPNPNGRRRDRGCGRRKPDRTFGADILTDIFDTRPVQALPILVRDSIGPDSTMTDGQEGLDHLNAGTGPQNVVYFDMRGRAPFRLTDWAAVFHGAGNLLGPCGAAPTFDTTIWEVIYHPTETSLQADPFALGNPGGEAVVTPLPLPHTIEFFGCTFDPAPFTTVLVEANTGANPPLISGGFFTIRPTGIGSSVVSTQSTEPISLPDQPADFYCPEGGPCTERGVRFAWRFEGETVP